MGSLGKIFRLAVNAARFAGKVAEATLANARFLRLDRRTPIEPRKIAIMTNTFRYTCNPKYIYEELMRRNADCDIVWLVHRADETADYPDDARVVRYGSKEGLLETCTAHVWLDNGIAFSSVFDKTAGHVHVQTMHGSLGIKLIDNAVTSRNKRGSWGRRVVRRESEGTDFVITNSTFEEGVFRRAFWKETPMMRLGHARTDILFADDAGKRADIRRGLRALYGVPEDHKLALLAPTHSRGLTSEDLLLDYRALKEQLEERFGGEFDILVRLHGWTRNVTFDDSAEAFVHDVGDYPDMQELILVADVGISDYSSWLFDYVLRRKPGFHYAPDVDSYEVQTGLAYPLEESPFPTATDEEALLGAIREFDDKAFQADVERFLEGKQSVDDGHSAERIADWLIEVMND